MNEDQAKATLQRTIEDFLGKTPTDPGEWEAHALALADLLAAGGWRQIRGDDHLEHLRWCRDQYRAAAEDEELPIKDRVAILKEYRTVVGQIARLEEAMNAGKGGASGKLEALASGDPDWDSVDVT